MDNSDQQFHHGNAPMDLGSHQEQGLGHMPSHKQRYLDAMMLSSVGGGDPNRSMQSHPDADIEASRRGEFDSSFASNGGAGHPDGGDSNYRNFRAMQMRGALPPNANSIGPEKDFFSHDRLGRTSLPQAPGSHNFSNDVPSDGMERRTSINMPPSVRNMSRENNSNSASPHPQQAMLPGGYLSQHVQDHEAYNYYMVNKHGSNPNPYYNHHYPIVSPDDTTDQIPFNNNGNIPYYPDDQRPPHPYAAYMLGQHQNKRARHAYDTMNHDYSNFPGQHGLPPSNGFSRTEQDMMHQQQGTFMLPSFNELRNHPHYNGMHPHMGMEPPAPAPVKPVKTKKRYSGDMPRRPLTAYNFFFSEEREIILAQLPDEDDPATSTEEGKENINGDNDKSEMSPLDRILSNMRKLDDEEMKNLKKKIRGNTERMLKIHKESDRVKKSHKKVHGKIAFQHLAKIVGQRWRSLDADEKKYYEDLASKDSNRYNEQLEEYNKKEQEAAVKKESTKEE